MLPQPFDEGDLSDIIVEEPIVLERTQSFPLLISLYLDLKKKLSKYDDNITKTLSPLMLNILECINNAYQVNKDYEFKIQLLEEANNLLNQRMIETKKIKLETDQELSSLKEAIDKERSELIARVGLLQSKVHLLELRHQNLLEYARTLEEKERGNQIEFDQLHSKYSELFRAYLIYSGEKELPEILERDLKILKRYFAEKYQDDQEESSVLSELSSVSISIEKTEEPETTEDQADTEAPVKYPQQKENAVADDTLHEQNKNDAVKDQQDEYFFVCNQKEADKDKLFREVWFDLEENSSLVLTREATARIMKLKKQIAKLQQELRGYRKNGRSNRPCGDDNFKTFPKTNSNGIYTKADVAKYLTIKNHFYMGTNDSLHWSQISKGWTIDSVKIQPVLLQENNMSVLVDTVS